MNNSYKNIKQSLDLMGITYLENEPMKKHTTFGIGGPVDLLVLPKDNIIIKDIINIPRGILITLRWYTLAGFV